MITCVFARAAVTVSTEHRIPNNELSPVRLPLALALVASLINLYMGILAVCSQYSSIESPDVYSPAPMVSAPRDKRTSFVSCLQLLLTMWAGHVTIDILPDDVLLCIFYFIRPESDRLWASVLVATSSSCVPQVAIRRFCVAKLSRAETCLRSLDTRGAHSYLATLSNHHMELEQCSLGHA